MWSAKFTFDESFMMSDDDLKKLFRVLVKVSLCNISIQCSPRITTYKSIYLPFHFCQGYVLKPSRYISRWRSLETHTRNRQPLVLAKWWSDGILRRFQPCVVQERPWSWCTYCVQSSLQNRKNYEGVKTFSSVGHRFASCICKEYVLKVQ